MNERDVSLQELLVLKEELASLVEMKDDLDKEKESLLKEKDRLLEEMGQNQQELLVASQKLLNMKRDLEARDRQADLTLRHFHQVQHELEYYFMISRKQAEMLQASEALQNKAFEFMVNRI